jgi:3-dehydroquinate dehydratase
LDEYAGELPIIATTGPRETTSDGVRETEFTDLRSAVAHDFVEAVSIELDVAKENEQILEPFREVDVDIIISYHNFAETPDLQNLFSIVKDAAALGSHRWVDYSDRDLNVTRLYSSDDLIIIATTPSSPVFEPVRSLRLH